MFPQILHKSIEYYENRQNVADQCKFSRADRRKSIPLPYLAKKRRVLTKYGFVVTFCNCKLPMHFLKKCGSKAVFPRKLKINARLSILWRACASESALAIVIARQFIIELTSRMGGRKSGRSPRKMRKSTKQCKKKRYGLWTPPVCQTTGISPRFRFPRPELVKMRPDNMF